MLLRIVLPLVVLAAAAGFFTRPNEAHLKAAADVVLRNPDSFSEGLSSFSAALAGERRFSDYYVATAYAVSVDGEPVVSCWGAFLQTNCSRAARPAKQ